MQDFAPGSKLMLWQAQPVSTLGKYLWLAFRKPGPSHSASVPHEVDLVSQIHSAVEEWLLTFSPVQPGPEALF